MRFDPGLLCSLPIQIRRSLLNEDEYGFRKAKRPMYYDEGLEVIRILFFLKGKIILLISIKKKIILLIQTCNKSIQIAKNHIG